MPHECRADRVPDKNGVDARFINEATEQRVVGCNHDQLLALPLTLGEIADSDSALFRFGFNQSARFVA